MVTIPTYQAQRNVEAPAYPTPRVDDSVGQALRSVGSAISSAAAEYKAHQDKMATYRANMDLQRLQNGAALQFEDDISNSAPDGTDLVERNQKWLADSYKKVRSGIKDPELGAKADLVFENLKGDYMLKGVKAAKGKATSYVLATTKEDADAELRSGNLTAGDALTSAAKYNEFFEKNIKRRIDSVIADPLDRQKAYAAFGSQLRDAYFQQHPEAARPRAGGTSYYSRLRQIESGGNDRAVNKDSGAAGRYQFIPSTAKRYGITDPLDPAQQETAVRRLTEDNRAYLAKKLGREPTPGELYLAHQQGAGGAARLLANPNERAVDIVGRRAVTLNGGDESMSAAQFAQMWVSRFDGASGMPSGGIFQDMTPDEWGQRVRAGQTRLAGDIGDTVPDELASLEFNGSYDGQTWGRDDFINAYGEDGNSRFESYDKAKALAVAKHNYLIMPESEILADLKARESAIGTGPGTAENVKAYGEAAGAAAAILKDRRDDPAGYVLRTDPAVKQAWAGADVSNPETARSAVAATVAAQRRLGIPDQLIAPLPKDQTGRIATAVNNIEAPVDERISALVASVMMGEDPAAQQAIFRELEKAGVPAKAAPAVDAYMRGDQAAARRLFEAATVKTENLPGKGQRVEGFDDSVSDALFADGTVGDAIYALDLHDPVTTATAQRDLELAKTAATLSMASGMDQATAIDQAVKDIHGNLTRIEAALPDGGHVLGAVDPDVAPDVLVKGMGLATIKVRQALLENKHLGLSATGSVIGEYTRNILTATTDFNIAATMSEGMFRNVDDGWGFFDPFTNTFVKDGLGKPLYWTTEQLTGMANAAAAPDDRPPPQGVKIPAQGAPPEMNPRLKQMMGIP